jgi:hypothetical protein
MSLQVILPLTGETFGHLTEEQVRSLDQFILRFTKLQDGMGNRLFSAILAYLQEPYENKPMLDKLNRLEKLGYIPSAETWQSLRATRNKFAHDYPDDWDRNAALINLAAEGAAEMYRTLRALEHQFETDHGPWVLGNPLPESWV